MPVPVLLLTRYLYLRPVRVSGTRAIAYVELVRINHVDTRIGFLRDWFFLGNRVNSANGRCGGFGKPVRWSRAFLSLVSRFPAIKAQIVIHAVLPFRWR